MNTGRQKIISVIGASSPSAQEYKYAVEAGRLLAENGLAVVCGGLGGVMEGACRGARLEGGLTIGILPVEDRSLANDFIDIVIPTCLGTARNAIVAQCGEAAIAIGGSFGTLSEIAFALESGRTVAALSSWRLEEPRLDSASFVRVDTPQEAVATVLKAVY
jgi:hypothetical protein